MEVEDAEKAGGVIPVKVVVRVRPFVPKEVNEGCQQTIQFFVEQNQLMIRSKEFAFDAVFDPSTSQQSVYDTCGSYLVEQLFKGYNCTILAYGQTGSGKTFTMGTEQMPDAVTEDRLGITPRIVAAIFERIAALADKFTFATSCSMLEIYNEKVLDLLGDKGEQQTLDIRESLKTGVFVSGLSERTITDVDDTLHRLEEGCSSRSRGETAMNAKSSRSHAVFSIQLKKTALNQLPGSDATCHAKLHLVDLAGSERLKKTQASGVRMEEGIKINEGLLALGNVISALTENRSHVPYRDSKLTRLLQDSLGGNSYTIMVACVSPADSNCEETLSTLNYAKRAKMIKNKPIINRDPREALIQRLQQENCQLREEVARYRCGGETTSGGGGDVGVGGAMDTGVGSKMNAASTQQLTELREQLFRLEQDAGRAKTQHAVTVAKLTLALNQAQLDVETLQDKMTSVKEKLTERLDTLATDGEDESRQTGGEFLRRLLTELQPSAEGATDDESYLDDREEQDTMEEGEEGGDEEAEKTATSYTDRQAAISAQVELLVDQIREKERLVQKTVHNYEQMQAHETHQKVEMDRLQSKIEELEKERVRQAEELRRLTNAKTVSEERRRRLQQLETELNGHRKQLHELKRLEKVKTENEQNIRQLKAEILDLKKVRVKMVKELKQESDKFRKWQVQYQREINQIKIKDRKRDLESEKVKKDFDRQLNVHRRKVEEAVALNRRLQQQLRAQELIRSRKFSEAQDDSRRMNEIQAFLEHEADLLTSNEEAKMMCDSLIAQRKQLTRDLNKVKRRLTRLDADAPGPAQPPLKKRNTSTDDGESPANTTFNVDDEQRNRLGGEIERLEQESVLRNSEIEQLQAKCASFDSSVKEDNRWDQMRTVVIAKCALKQLFEMLIASKVRRLQTANELEDARSWATQQQRQLADVREQMKAVVKDAAARQQALTLRINEQGIQHQNEMGVIIRQCAKLIGGEDLDAEGRELLDRRLKNLDNFEKMQDELIAKNDAILLGQRKLKKSAGKKQRTYFNQVVETEEVIPVQSQRTRSSRVSKPPERFRCGALTSASMSRLPPLTSVQDRDEQPKDDDDSSTENDRSQLNDSDYVERNETQTKKLAATRRRPMHSASASSLVPLKKNTSATSLCRCQTKCSSGQCGCRRNQHQCSAACGCDVTVCENRAAENDAKRSVSSDSDKDMMNTTFQVQVRPTSEEEEGDDEAFSEQGLLSRTTRKTATAKGAKAAPKRGNFFASPLPFAEHNSSD